jgi:hypothetical protein
MEEIVCDLQGSLQESNLNPAFANDLAAALRPALLGQSQPLDPSFAVIPLLSAMLHEEGSVEFLSSVAMDRELRMFIIDLLPSIPIPPRRKSAALAFLSDGPHPGAPRTKELMKATRDNHNQAQLRQMIARRKSRDPFESMLTLATGPTTLGHIKPTQRLRTTSPPPESRRLPGACQTRKDLAAAQADMDVAATLFHKLTASAAAATTTPMSTITLPPLPPSEQADDVVAILDRCARTLSLAMDRATLRCEAQWEAEKAAVDVITTFDSTTFISRVREEERLVGTSTEALIVRMGG